MPLKTKTIVISMGDPAGIGAEITAKSLQDKSLPKKARFIIVGDKSVFHRYETRDKNYEFIDLKKISAKRFVIGQSDRLTGQASLAYLDHALKLIAQKAADGLVTAPLSKEAVSLTGTQFLGHTEYIAHRFKVKHFGMMFVGGKLKTVLVTRHIPLSEVSKAITSTTLSETILLTSRTLKNIFKINDPRMAVCGINPHAGERGTIGREEIRVVIPTIRKLQKKGLKISGPFAADTLFHPNNSRYYDCIIAMYHDQGLAPLKTLYFENLVNLTIGLPFVRTSPAHGTAFNLAGKNLADPSSMKAAIRLACQLS